MRMVEENNAGADQRFTRTLIPDRPVDRMPDLGIYKSRNHKKEARP